MAQLLMQLDNSKSKINNVSMAFALKQRLTVVADGHTISKTYVKVRRTLRGIGAGKVSEGKTLSLNLPEFKTGDAAKLDQSGLKSYLLRLPEENATLNSSTKSKLISSEYYLEASCPMDSCCSPTPSITCAVEIYYPTFVITAPTVPTDWKPEELPNTNLAMYAPPQAIQDAQLFQQDYVPTTNTQSSDMVVHSMIQPQNADINLITNEQTSQYGQDYFRTTNYS